MPERTTENDAASVFQPTLALIDDEVALCEEIAFQLRHMGFRVYEFHSAESFYRQLAVTAFDVALIDIGLPGEDGLSICRHLRAHGSNIGIIFLTARAMREDRIMGLSLGADAYLPKPVDVEELALLSRSLAARARAERIPHKGSAPSVSKSSSRAWGLDLNGPLLTAPDGTQIPLTRSEAALLKVLDDHRGTICVFSDLLVGIGCGDDPDQKHRLAVIINRIRGKVLKMSTYRLPIQVERGIGYRYFPDRKGGI